VRILFVAANRESVPYPVAPLGVAYVAGAARSAGHEVRLLDLCFSESVEADIAAAVQAFAPDLVGVSIRNVDNLTYPSSVSYLDEIAAAVSSLRRHCGAPLVAGGPGFSIFPERLLAFLGLDFGVVGEGEETLCRLARYLEEGRAVPDLPNVIRRGEPARAARRSHGPFADNGRPARDLLDNARYLALGGMANLQAKRGCPFECAYCTYPQIDGASLRLRPPAAVADELAAMVEEAQIDEAFFVDDIFTWPAEHALSICEEIVARRLRVGWTCFATPIGMTPTLAHAMKRAGCRGVEFGADTASPSVLRALGKPFPQDDLRAAARACREAGLPAAYYLIFGGPGETAATVGETCALIDDLQPQAVLAFVGIRIYPNTPLHGIAVSDGVVAADDDLLRPRFYISPAIGGEELTAAVAGHARGRPNWVVPALGIRSDPALLSRLRRSGRRGPLWDLL
jgi:radical SAM superfamily enzyme YgiQ (UPF0313 family)